MHRLFREQLDDAVGRSEFVVAQNIDIRGFSDWSLTVDSAQTALYIKKVYARLIDDYLTEASFVKPTGDGLLVVQAFAEDELEDVAKSTVHNAVDIVTRFETLVSDDAMVNFPVPGGLGIGIARGTASRLGTDDRTLDYSGRVLNLASRLMDLARPYGVVVDGDFGMELLPETLSSKFHDDKAYLKGIAPAAPLTVHCWPDSLTVPASHRMPLDEEQWHDLPGFDTTRKDLAEAAVPGLRLELKPLPPLPGIKPVCIAHSDSPTPGGRRSKTRRSEMGVPVELAERAGKKVAQINQHELAQSLDDAGVGPTWPVTLQVSYRVG